MQLVCLILALIALGCKVQSSSICDSELCVCRDNNKSAKDEIGEVIVCSYFPNILESNLTLPNTVFSLDLSWNNLTSVNSPLFKMNTLSELLLNNNEIQKIDSALLLPTLKKLDLSNNRLEFIAKESFEYINKLEYLNLANNQFNTLSSLSFHHLSDLVEIVLDNNNIGGSLRDKNLFDRSGYGLTHKLRSLSIRGIGLNVVQDNFFVDAYDLRKLIVSNNNLSELFEFPITLEYLDLSDNPIKEISEEDFAEVPALTDLLLNNLSISEVPEFVFSSLRGLIKLQLERNKDLTEFNALAFGQDVLEDSDDFVLETLSVKGSKLTSLSEELNEPFGRLINLDLQGNLWNCDCNLNWVKKLQIKKTYSEHLRCYTPRILYNSKIMEIKKSFICTAQRHITGVMIGAVTACVLLTFVAAWIYVMVPKQQSRSNFIKNIYSSSHGYSLLPVNVNFSNAM